MDTEIDVEDEETDVVLSVSSDKTLRRNCIPRKDFVEKKKK